ncbi:MAG TPA: GNAT family N-acetyltransferase [Thermomicrobiales bacterium]|nr:GNAT family N-acetyltransferase [Thermomicrobiales bacterium]
MQLLALDDARWAEFVGSRADATPFHHPAWARLLADCYGYRPFVLAAPAGAGELVGGLPVLEVNAPWHGRRWVSLPFTDYCPPLAPTADTPGGLAVALDTARERARVSRLELRAPLGGPASSAGAAAVRHTLRLQADDRALLRTFKPSQVQRNIKRAEREGVEARRGAARADLVDTYYRLHLQTRQRLGAPVQPRRFFDLLWRRMLEPGLGFVLLATVRGQPVAGAVFLAWNGTIIYKYGASDAAHWKARPNHAIFWAAIRWGCEHGYHTFDFGRTDLDNAGLRDFKAGWGTTEEPLRYTTLADRPARHGSGRSSKALGAVIRRSPPWVCRCLGEVLYKYAA